MATRRYTTTFQTWVRAPGSTSLTDRTIAALIFPALLLIALAGFAQPEALRHCGANPRATVIALVEVAR